MGTNPAEIKTGPRKGPRFLAKEEDLEGSWLSHWTKSNAATAVITNFAPRDIITGDSRKAKWLEPSWIELFRDEAGPARKSSRS
jgi:hypothetical protein